MKKRFSEIAGWSTLLLILCQIIPLNRIEPTAETPKSIPVEVLSVLRTHCYNCHSGETRWPRSAYIAPLSWYVTGKVRQARQAFNLSGYNSFPVVKRQRLAATLSRMALTAGINKHGQIPGFSAFRLNERERMLLIGWLSGNNRE
ncbi:MAG: heme-binding domain-containing protein [Chlorobiaceae bacterium]|jgi:hypothetical protein|nr:heme-binding domain-containing protein [Chlorobiaceae bacterium]